MPLGDHIVDTGFLASMTALFLPIGLMLIASALTAPPRSLPGGPGWVGGVGAIMVTTSSVVGFQAFRQWYYDRLEKLGRPLPEKGVLERLLIRFREIWSKRKHQRGLADKTTLEVAKRYGGILSSTVLVFETAIPFEAAESELERLVSLGVAFKRLGGITYSYDVPDARTHLAHGDRQIVEALAMFEGELSRVELLRRLGFPIEALDDSLLRLEQLGVLARKGDRYQLRGLRTHQR